MSNIPIELIKIILEYLNDIDVNRYFGIYKPINIKKFKNLESICWTNYRNINLFKSALRSKHIFPPTFNSINSMPRCVGEIYTYYFPSIRTKQQNIIRVEYNWKGVKGKKVYVKLLEFHTLKDNFDRLDDHCQLLKLRKRAESSLWGDKVEGCYWDNVLSIVQQKKPFF